MFDDKTEGVRAAVFESRVASADASLMEITPTNSNGGDGWVLAGSNGILSPSSLPYRNRGLYKFDLSNLPATTVVLSAVVVLEVTRIPDVNPVPSTFGLHRMLRPWGEGVTVAGTGPPGQGGPAALGDVTWDFSFFNTNAWTAPGADGDFDGESTFSSIAGLGSYQFDFTLALLADVQFWIQHPENNFGWLLLCNDESTPRTARRFGSREDGGNAPRLEISYLVPPIIDLAQRVGSSFQLQFTPWPGQGYAVQFRTNLATGTWQTLTNLGIAPDATPFVVTDSAALPQRFYRVLGY